MCLGCNLSRQDGRITSSCSQTRGPYVGMPRFFSSTAGHYVTATCLSCVVAYAGSTAEAGAAQDTQFWESLAMYQPRNQVQSTMRRSAQAGAAYSWFEKKNDLDAVGQAVVHASALDGCCYLHHPTPKSVLTCITSNQSFTYHQPTEALISKALPQSHHVAQL